MAKVITFDRFVRMAGIGLLIAAIFCLINYLSSVLIPFFVAWLLAYLLYPIVKFVENKLHVRIRALSIIITMIFVVSVVSLIVYLIIPPMIDQFQKLYVILSHWVHETTHTNSISEWLSQVLTENHQRIEAFFKSPDFTATLKSTAPKFFNVLSQTASIILSIVASLITLLYMFFILMDYEYLTANWIRIFPPKVRPFWNELMNDVERELNNYIRGQSAVAACMGVMFCVGFSLLDFPMAIGLGILIGIMDLVPYLHTFALIPTAFLAMLKAADTGQNFWVIFGLAVGLFAVVQIITDMIVTPKIMGKAMGLNPAVLLLSLSVWGTILGFIGLIVALPLTTIIIAYWQRYVTREGDRPMHLARKEENKSHPTPTVQQQDKA
ncbi:MAG: AI-2E family transporter [Prevotella sp.]|uniref:AI-2E family transporter n=1 Tax=Hallella faecis TaxID=2841596 RepID=A0ABV1FSN8_9BACT|nr:MULTISPECIES: AI-2E family transporter [Hallella]MBS7399813.1 AI-2E family transporter [Prevotella sp.]MBU0290652.1 AI-2E family transporter [Hallella faecis]MCI7434928.1 AI-2E family transporter [Prevotella sp.]MED9944995.1 AI-2E family transporter [Hallella sp.]